MGPRHGKSRTISPISHGYLWVMKIIPKNPKVEHQLNISKGTRTLRVHPSLSLENTTHLQHAGIFVYQKTPCCIHHFSNLFKMNIPGGSCQGIQQPFLHHLHKNKSTDFHITCLVIGRPKRREDSSIRAAWCHGAWEVGGLKHPKKMLFFLVEEIDRILLYVC